MGDQSDYAKTQHLADCLYVGLYVIAPTDAGGGTELSSAGYARQAVTWTLSGDTAVNAADIVFQNAGVDWPNVVALGVFDAEIGGHMADWKAISTVRVKSGGNYTVPAGKLKVTF